MRMFLPSLIGLQSGAWFSLDAFLATKLVVISSASLLKATLCPVGGRSMMWRSLMGMVSPVRMSLAVKLEDI